MSRRHACGHWYVEWPGNATQVPYSEIMTVFENLGDTIDQQIRVVDIGDDLNVAVGVLRRVGARTEGEAVTAIIHHRLTEVYYILSGSGILITGGDESDAVEFPAGVPHGFRHIQEQITYLSIRVDHEQVLPTGYVHPSLE